MPLRSGVRPVVSTVLVLCAVGALAGCTPATPPARLPAGVTVGILQNRDDYGPRRLEIAVTNGSTSTLRIDSATFLSPSITGEASDSGAEIPAGSTVDFRVVLGATICEPEPGTDAVRLAFTDDAGSAGSADLTPTDPFGAIRNVVAQDCAEQLTQKTVAIALADELTTSTVAGVLTAHLAVTFTPTGAGAPVRIPSVRRTILLRPASGADTWPVALSFDAASAPRTVTLDIVPANCRLHTVTEDKRGTYLPFDTVTSSGAGLFYIGTTVPVKEQVYRYIAAFCGWDASTPLD